MRVFVTGASGYIGSAVVHELINAGHQVLGLARSDAAADAVARLGAEVHRGDLSDLKSLAAGARACEGVIHLAFIADFSTMTDNLEKDRLAIETLGGALQGPNAALVIPSVTLALKPGRLAKETDAPDPNAFGSTRVPSEQAALAATSRACACRLCACRLRFTVTAIMA
jgi:uncharacterized protein YbjT (DUF2867 family)